MPDISSEATLLEYEIASLQFVAALTHVPSIREAAKERLAVRRRRLRKLNSIDLYSTTCELRFVFKAPSVSAMA
jgi:hypothetical protein